MILFSEDFRKKARELFPDDQYAVLHKLLENQSIIAIDLLNYYSMGNIPYGEIIATTPDTLEILRAKAKRIEERRQLCAEIKAKIQKGEII